MTSVEEESPRPSGSCLHNQRSLIIRRFVLFERPAILEKDGLVCIVFGIMMSMTGAMGCLLLVLRFFSIEPVEVKLVSVSFCACIFLFASW